VVWTDGAAVRGAGRDMGSPDNQLIEVPARLCLDAATINYRKVLVCQPARLN
jgi:hypothetical protein